MCVCVSEHNKIIMVCNSYFDCVYDFLNNTIAFTCHFYMIQFLKPLYFPVGFVIVYKCADKTIVFTCHSMHFIWFQ